MRSIGALTILAVVSLAISSSGCGGKGGSPAPTVAVAVYLRGAAPVPVVDQTGRTVFTMTGLRLTIEGATLEGSNGHVVPLELPANPYLADLMSLADTSDWLAGGTLPPGTYDGLGLTVTAAEMLGTSVGSQSPEVVALRVPAPEFEAEFQAVVVFDLGRPATIVIDWRPAVSASAPPGTGPTIYTLEDDVHALVLGGAGSSGPGQPFHDLDGDVVAVDCLARILTIENSGFIFVMALDGQTLYVDDNGATLLGGCAGLAVGDEVEVGGTTTPNGIVASLVTIEDAGGALRGGSTEVRGIVRNAATTPAGIEFDLVSGTGALLAHVSTDSATDFEFDNGGPTTSASVVDGGLVEVEGGMDLLSGRLVADEVEIR